MKLFNYTAKKVDKDTYKLTRNNDSDYIIIDIESKAITEVCTNNRTYTNKRYFKSYQWLCDELFLELNKKNEPTYKLDTIVRFENDLLGRIVEMKDNDYIIICSRGRKHIVKESNILGIY